MCPVGPNPLDFLNSLDTKLTVLRLTKLSSPSIFGSNHMPTFLIFGQRSAQTLHSTSNLKISPKVPSCLKCMHRPPHKLSLSILETLSWTLQLSLVTSAIKDSFSNMRKWTTTSVRILNGAEMFKVLKEATNGVKLRSRAGPLTMTKQKPWSEVVWRSSLAPLHGSLTRLSLQLKISELALYFYWRSSPYNVTWQTFLRQLWL